MRKTKTPSDLYEDELRSWRRDLLHLEVDVTDFEPLHTNLVRVDQLREHATRLHEERTRPAGTAITVRTLATNTLDYEAARDTALQAAKDADTARYIGDAVTIIENAVAEAILHTWASFRARKDRNLDLLRGPFTAHTSEALTLWATIPAHVTRETDATGEHLDTWQKLKEHAGEIQRIINLLEAWLTDGMLNTRGARSNSEHRELEAYNLSEFYLDDPTAATLAGNGASDPVTRMMRHLEAGTPHLRTITEVDQHRSLSDVVRTTPTTSTVESAAHRNATRDRDNRKERALTTTRSRPRIR